MTLFSDVFCIGNRATPLIVICIKIFNTRQNLIESRQPGQATDLTDQADKNRCFSKYFVKKSVKTR